MSHADWRPIARRAGFVVSPGGNIRILLEGRGTQAISIEMSDDSDALLARSIIASARVVREAATDGSPWRYAWERNRLSDLCGFTLDRRGRLVGETWIPLDGLTHDEFSLYVTELARVCDWHEFRLTGQDVE